MRTLIIDNYDSFTFNLFQLVAKVTGVEPLIVPNDALSPEALLALPYDVAVISPGPGRPDVPADFGASAAVLADPARPVLGVCLGHQGVAQAFGGRVERAPRPMHGRASAVCHDGSALFAGVPQGFQAVRYHSLVVAEPLPGDLACLARSDDGLVMALAHRRRPVWGLQFHPESVGTEVGPRLIENFFALARGALGRAGRGPWGEPHRRLSSLPRAAPQRAVRAPRPQGALALRARKLEGRFDPARAFAALYGGSTAAFWLDSSLVRPGLARFSFLGDGAGPEGEWLSFRAGAGEFVRRRGEHVERGRGDLFALLGAGLARAGEAPGDELPFAFRGGYVGYFGYEMKAACGGEAAHESPHPDAQFLFADRFVAFDHAEGATYLVCLERAGAGGAARAWFDATEATLRALGPGGSLAGGGAGEGDSSAGGGAGEGDSAAGGGAGAPALRWGRGRERYLADVEACLRLLEAGETYEVCLTDRLRGAAGADPFGFYLALRAASPAPYAAFLRFGELAVACSSPERFLRVGRDGGVESKPIKGTAPRGASAGEDEALARALGASEKDRAENLMIVDLVRNDLGRACEVGSVRVPSLMAVETYASVHQLVSTVRGDLRAGLGALDCVRAAFPPGSMTGAPKARTMRIIDRLEGEARGVYSGAIGYLSLGGAADLNVVIRSATFGPAGVEIGAGGAVVALSSPAAEFDEARLKAGALMRALARSKGGA